jgi:hypothetical protein
LQQNDGDDNMYLNDNMKNIEKANNGKIAGKTFMKKNSNHTYNQPVNYPTTNITD